MILDVEWNMQATFFRLHLGWERQLQAWSWGFSTIPQSGVGSPLIPLGAVTDPVKSRVNAEETLTFFVGYFIMVLYG